MILDQGKRENVKISSITSSEQKAKTSCQHLELVH